MKRRYPASFFFFGVLTNLFRYGILLILSLVLTVVGLCGIDICVKLGWAVLAIYLAVCVGVQIQIRHAALTRSDNEEYNRMMDEIFGVGDGNNNGNDTDDKNGNGDNNNDKQDGK